MADQALNLNTANTRASQAHLSVSFASLLLCFSASLLLFLLPGSCMYHELAYLAATSYGAE